MFIDMSKDHVFAVPARYDDVSMLKVYGDQGGLVCVILDVGGGVLVHTADEPDFASFCEQYGIKAERAREIKV